MENTITNKQLQTAVKKLYNHHGLTTYQIADVLSITQRDVIIIITKCK